jgi:hypothetical protein
MWEVEVLYRVRGRKTEGVGQSEIRDKEKSPGQYGVSKQCRWVGWWVGICLKITW